MNDIKNEVLRGIWEDRYRKNGETLEENYRRVAKYVASNSAEEEEFFEVISEGMFLPAGRTMSNSGIGESLTLNNCFKAGTKVITSEGLKNIEDVKIGDMVLSADNKYHRVNNTMVRDYNGDIYHIKSKSLYDDIYCTPNHRFLTQNGWVRADRLMIGPRVIDEDGLKIPNPASSEYAKIDEIIIEENQSCKVYNLSVEEEHSYTANGVVCHNCYVAPQIPDDLSSIFDSVKLGAITHKAGGGIGYDFSKIRPAGQPTSNDAIASGPVSFMEVFNTQTSTILQGNRRGM